MTNGCSFHGWSIVTSASADSQIAGVLAGFVFTGVVLLLGRRGPKSIQTLCLFAATFVALGFDSHLWGVVSGDAADTCARVWSEGMAAAGMLAVSGMAIVTGIGWLLAGHLNEIIGSTDKPGVTQIDRVISLTRFVRFMAYGVGIIVTLLLGVTTSGFLAAVFSSHMPGFLAWVALIPPVFVLVVSAGLTILGKAWCVRHMDITLFDLCNTGLTVAAYGMLSYAVAAPIFGGVIFQLGVNSWRPPSGVIVSATIATGLVFPALLVVALVQAVPPLSVEGVLEPGNVESVRPESLPRAQPESMSVGMTAAARAEPLTGQSIPQVSSEASLSPGPEWLRTIKELVERLVVRPKVFLGNLRVWLLRR